jgi:hypothetical protein
VLVQYETRLNDLEEEQAENYLDEDNFLDGKKNDTNVKKRIKVLDKQ